MRKSALFLISLLLAFNLFAQKQKTDSLKQLFLKTKIDSTKAKLLWMMADASYLYNPDTSILLAQQSLYLSQKIKYTNGESYSLGVLATAFTKIGNYPKALDFYLQKLKIDEKENDQRNLASALINTGTLYVYQKQYTDALAYYTKADSVIKSANITELEYYSNNDLGDVYERLQENDSAFIYFNRALSIAINMKDPDLQGASMVGLGHVYLNQNKLDLALQYYLHALGYLESSNDDDLICEVSLGLAKLYDKRNISDSTVRYAQNAFIVAKKDGFESRQLEAAVFLTDHYKKTGDVKNAFAFIETAQSLKDSIYSDEKIRQSQIISTNEQLRQNEMAENKRRADEERHQQLQMLLIGIFIPILFLITLLLSRIKIHRHVIKFLAVLSLLMFFEYLLLLLHPKVEEITNDTPLYEILVFVAITSVLIPAHHRIEHWLIEKLTKVKSYTEDKIVIATQKIHIKKSSEED